MTLKPSSVTELNKLYDFLVRHPEIYVEISGHTDNTGPATYNQKLSEKRAQSVVNYLVERGIGHDRLLWAGYGEERPVADNSTEAGRALNRRTELKVVRILPSPDQ